MSKTLKAVQRDKVALEDKLQLLEFKTAKKIKKARTKIDNIAQRLGIKHNLCKRTDIIKTLNDALLRHVQVPRPATTASARHGQQQ